MLQDLIHYGGAMPPSSMFHCWIYILGKNTSTCSYIFKYNWNVISSKCEECGDGKISVYRVLFINVQFRYVLGTLLVVTKCGRLLYISKYNLHFKRCWVDYFQSFKTSRPVSFNKGMLNAFYFVNECCFRFFSVTKWLQN